MTAGTNKERRQASEIFKKSPKILTKTKIVKQKKLKNPCKMAYENQTS